MTRGTLTILVWLLAAASPARAQHESMHMPMAPDTAATPRAATHHPARAAMDHAMHDMGSSHGMGHAHMSPAFLGPYAITRAASGTSWQPEATPHEALHGGRGA